MDVGYAGAGDFFRFGFSRFRTGSTFFPERNNRPVNGGKTQRGEEENGRGRVEKADEFHGVSEQRGMPGRAEVVERDRPFGQSSGSGLRPDRRPDARFRKSIFHGAKPSPVTVISQVGDLSYWFTSV